MIDDLEVGPGEVYVYEKATAFLDNSQLRVTAVDFGVAGNLVSLALVSGGASGTRSVAIAERDIVLTFGAGTTIAQALAALKEDRSAQGLITPMLAPGGAAFGDILIADAETSLAGGSETETEVNIGQIGEDMSHDYTIEATRVTGHRQGNTALTKVVSGGTCQLKLPMKSINLRNLQRIYPTMRLFDDGAGKLRVEALVRAGTDLRAFAKRWEIRKYRNGAPSTLPEDITKIYEATPADSPTSFVYHPTNQRMVSATLEVWPNLLTGGFFSIGHQTF